MIDLALARRVFSCIDNTTLNATDNRSSVEAFCRHTAEMRLADGTTVAAVCVYPQFTSLASEVLQGTGIGIASVESCFPHGQAPLIERVGSVASLTENGADEVDMVINRGWVLDGDYKYVEDEVDAIKRACRGKTLKVILEICELSLEQVRLASEAAIRGGADFIKTSTGKGSGGATLEAAEIMLNCIKNSVNFNKKTIGFKAAGGIREPEEALEYAHLAKKIMGDNYINSQTFRIGASRLTDKLYSLLTF